MPVRSPLASLAGPALRLQTDARLVTLSREGHDRAFEEIVRRYRSPLVRFAGSIVAADRAEDVVQEAFERTHTAIASSDAELALRPWLYRVVRNGALNNLRDHHPHEQLDPEYDGVPQPPDIAARREELAATVAAINALPAAQRDAIVKRELEGRGHEEIAADLGVSAGAVRQLIFRARTTLRNGLGSLVPLPVVRALLEAGSAGAGAAGAGAAALGVAGGGGIALKTGAAIIIAGLALGSGVALRGDLDHSPDVATAAPAAHGAESGRARSAADESRRASDSGGGADSAHGEDGHGQSGSERSGESGPGGSEDTDEGQSGPGDGGDDGHSGPGGDDGPGDDGDGGNSGPGGGDEPPDDGGDDDSGSGGGGEPAEDPPEPPEDDDGPEPRESGGDGLDV